MNPKKEQIVEAALSLFVHKGFRQTSIQDILDRANVAKGTFYNYFASKNDCLLAILEYVNEIGNRKRAELARGRKSTDENLFVEQVAVRTKLNREFNIVSLFESVAFSSDEKFMSFMKDQYFQEIDWIGKRLMEMYAPSSKKYAADQAIILLSMIHHFMHVAKLLEQQVQIEDVVRYALHRIQPIINDQPQTKEVFFSPYLFEQDVIKENTKEHLENKLTILISTLEGEEYATQAIEYIHYLLNQLSSKHPKLYVMESVLHSLVDILRATHYEEDVRHINQLFWQWKNRK